MVDFAILTAVQDGKNQGGLSCRANFEEEEWIDFELMEFEECFAVFGLIIESDEKI